MLIITIGCSRTNNLEEDTETTTSGVTSDSATETSSENNDTVDSGVDPTENEDTYNMTDSHEDTAIMTDTQRGSDTYSFPTTGSDTLRPSDSVSDSDENTEDSSTVNDGGTPPVDTETVSLSCDPVQFEDPNFEVLIRAELDIPADSISSNDISTLRSIHIYPEYVITRINGIECAQNLYIFDCENSSIESFGMLVYNEILHEIYIDNCSLVNLSFIANLNNLSRLELENNRISALDPLRNHTIYLIDLYNNPLQNISALEEVQISVLGLSRTGISALPSLKRMGLTSLSAAQNKITDITPIIEIAQEPLPQALPYTIVLNDNIITDLSPFLEILNALAGVELTFYGNPPSKETLNEVIPALCLAADYISWGEDEECGEVSPGD